MITFDNADSFKLVSSGTHSKSFTCAASAKMFVLADSTITAVTYAGVSLTAVITHTPLYAGGHLRTLKIWYLANPASGSNTLDCTLSGTSACAVVTYKGMKSSGYENYGEVTKNDGINQIQGVNISTSLTPNSVDAWVVFLGQGANNATRGFTTPSTNIRTSWGDLFTDSLFIYDNGSPINPTSSTTLTATWTSSSGFLSGVIMSIPVDNNNGFLTFFP